MDRNSTVPIQTKRLTCHFYCEVISSNYHKELFCLIISLSYSTSFDPVFKFRKDTEKIMFRLW